MKRKLLMVLLALGAVAGFGAGFARLCHGAHGHHGPGGRHFRHADLERRVADACTASALRVYGQKPGAGSEP